MVISRIWIFRGLVAVAAALMVVSFIKPWWTAGLNIVAFEDPMRIYAYGFRHSLDELAAWVATDETPFFQTVLAFVYLGTSVSLVMLSTWLKGRKGQILLGTVGLVYIAYVLIAIYIVVTNRIDDYNIALQGHSITSEWAGDESVESFSRLRFGYYLALATGISMVVLAVLRKFILGRQDVRR